MYSYCKYRQNLYKIKFGFIIFGYKSSIKTYFWKSQDSSASFPTSIAKNFDQSTDSDGPYLFYTVFKTSGYRETTKKTLGQKIIQIRENLVSIKCWLNERLNTLFENVHLRKCIILV